VSIGFRIETLSGRHKLSEFQCGTEPLDRYFREQVTQDIRRRATLCYVAVAETGKVAGDYAALLWDAAMRAARSEMAVFTLVVDAKDAAAERFYRHHGMTAVGNSGRQLLFPLARLKC
jgi:hypothetical protein